MEERRGFVRWLRPDYQTSRFGISGLAVEQSEIVLFEGRARKPGVPPKPSFPKDEVEQTGAVIRVLLGANAPLDTDAVAAGFRQGSRQRSKVEAILNALARQGVASTMDGGVTFSMRRAA